MSYLTLLFLALPAFADPGSAKLTVERFYKTYLGTPHKEKHHMAFSAGFRALQKKDEAACKKFAGSDICGWGADGDVYLNAQDYDPKLSFKNSGLVATETEPGQVKVAFNLFPHDKTQGNANQRSLTFLLVKEKGVWVVDDILTADSSARKDIASEIAGFEKVK